MTKKKKKDLFSRIASYYDKLIGDFDYDSLNGYLDLYKEDILLDIGGGTGRASKVLEKEVNQCIILERSFEMLNQAKKSSKSIFLIQGLSNNIPLRNGCIDKIFVNDTLHHIKKQEKTIEQCNHVLDEKGKLIIRDYDRSYFWNFLLILFEKILMFKSKFLTPSELENIVKKYGFSNISIKRPSKATYIFEATK
ncbi:MAG: class I SAM-dependent methyltransferase [Candidatus Heimdallarchaeum endolithica]|uniref:Class I SAM-dependent methyltransferase n=1 Tax=Candidatus Heimdallarchaeum endolithica TaxID=2876572 RepID=A0A9Y1FNY2_9ARCH|nr:MAG: class I SAM-dependent methyltransferase [Candidatus Heimdallarchaeum endolithica]